MTGNTKIWRAPLAGLASVAMIATMGMAAATANASAGVESTTFVQAEQKATYTLTVDANGGKFDNPTNYVTTVEGAITGSDDKVTFNDAKTVATITNVPAEVTNIIAAAIFSTSEITQTNRTIAGFYTAASIGEGSALDTTNGFTLSADTTVYPHWYKTGDTLATVTFQYDSSANDTVTVIPGDKLADWQIPQAQNAKTSPTQLGDYWVTDKNVKFTSDTAVSENMTVTPHLRDTVTITYEALGSDSGAAVDPSKKNQLVIKDEAFATPAGLITGTPASKVLEGWYESKKSTPASYEDYADTAFDFSKGASENTTLYAKFAPQASVITVTYYYAKSGAEYGTDSVSANGKFSVNEPPVPSDPQGKGREFLGWYNQADDAKWDFNAAATTGLKLYAKWGTAAGEETMVFDPNYTGSNVINVESNADGTFTAPTVERDGWTFDGWYDTALSSGGNEFDASKTDYNTSSVVFYARWTPLKSTYKKAATDLSTQTVFTDASVKAYQKAYNAAKTKYDLTGDPDGSKLSDDELKEATEAFQAAQALLVVKTSETAPVYRVYNKADNKHLYTSNHAEALSLIAGGWRDEGVAYYTLDLTEDQMNDPSKSYGALTESGLYTPVYRLYDKPANRHFYTKDKSEKDNLVKSGWRDEGVAYYARTQGGVAVYRAYSPSRYEHLFTTSEAEYETATTANGEGWYRAENIGFYTEK